MGKNPAFQFYVKDWLTDTQLRLASPATRGIWIDLLCYMWDAPVRGEISCSIDKLGMLVGAQNGECHAFVTEIKALKFGEISVDVTDGHEIVTLRNRRMYREQSKRNNWKKRKQKQRSHGDVPEKSPPHSPSPSPNKEIYKEKVLLSRDEYERLCADFGKEIVDSKIEDLGNYAGTNPKKFNGYEDHNLVIRTWLKKDGVKRLNHIEDEDLCHECKKKRWTKNGLCAECHDEKMNGG